ncbi:adenine nucleotide alpha hydrolase [Pyrrhoderma noxium]|uniref:Adenine nucleotide alpha hydrolase n=1 Tax=Pyrrhoderma noxium TaxID=2282107 RepID=A0A286UBH6_9AGAM|nr:adenine nucleotide alpha hydrolase [Pyrrhoderma noxium]
MNGRRPRKYVVATDLSPESNYALEWGIGTVLRDGDEMILISVNETESKLDPQHPNPTDRVSKLRNQQERQALAYVLARQALELLQRTRLNVTVVCQAWHAKNTRHIILDIVDHYEPTMLIVGSRGLGQLKGILLGSTSHYLVQKCSVPVMVARRRLKRPAKRSAHLNTHRARVSLAEAAGIERVTPKVDRDVEEMRDQLQRENEADAFAADADGDGAGDDEDTEHEDESMGTAPIGQKVAGD